MDIDITFLMLVIWIALIVIGFAVESNKRLSKTKIGNIIVGFGGIFGLVFSIVYVMSFDLIMGLVCLFFNIILLMHVLMDIIR